jgi:serine/threonine protein kinase/Tfp pilus assembly protein PilF
VLPAVGDTLFGFHLTRELGRGAFAWVFLAEQVELAGRPVVLKVSAIRGREPQMLAQLQHTHIVPIHSVHEDPRAGLRAVCMPYFGGAGLDVVLGRLFAQTPRPAQGADFVRALEEVEAERIGAAERRPPAEETAKAPALEMLRGMRYPEAVAWIIARLAEALQHAHQRRVLHRDIKPSNILLAADGQPMLLDFNVALDLRTHAAQGAVLGGTVAYMAPEHLAALNRRDPDHAVKVDHRSEIYSLGLVFYEMLAGTRPFTQEGSYAPRESVIEVMAQERTHHAPSLRRLRTDLPWSLDSIAHKCLHPDPNQRYRQAEHLAEDLNRFLNNLPLKYATERSWVERFRKWVRRHPSLTSSGAVGVVASLLLLGSAATVVGVRAHLIQTQERLETAQVQERRRAFEEDTQQALCLVNTVSIADDQLPQGIAVCERALASFDILDRAVRQSGDAGRRLGEAERQRLGEDARDLLLLLAWARVRLAPTDRRVLRQALDLLDRAEAIEGLPPSRAIWEDRARYLERSGDGLAARAARERAQQLQPTSARDHYQLATVYARSGRYPEAVAHLDEALRLNPRHYWSTVQRGICHQELGHSHLAVADFGAAVGLWPEAAWGYFNRGCALDRCGDKAAALLDYTAALKREPDFVPALLNRGMVYLERREYAAALTDFRRTAELGRDDAVLHSSLGAVLEGMGRFAEADAAWATARARAGWEDSSTRDRLRLLYGFSVAARLPAKALEAFAAVGPGGRPHLEALYGQAMILTKQGQARKAVACYDQALTADPQFSEARRYRAILRARLGELAEASADINRCLEQSPRAGEVRYAAACVASLASGQAHDPEAARATAEQAMSFLRTAFTQGYGRDRAAQDTDLKVLWDRADFRRLVAKMP